MDGAKGRRQCRLRRAWEFSLEEEEDDTVAHGPPATERGGTEGCSLDFLCCCWTERERKKANRPKGGGEGQKTDFMGIDPRREDFNYFSI